MIAAQKNILNMNFPFSIPKLPWKSPWRWTRSKSRVSLSRPFRPCARLKNYFNDFLRLQKCFVELSSCSTRASQARLRRRRCAPSSTRWVTRTTTASLMRCSQPRILKVKPPSTSGPSIIPHFCMFSLRKDLNGFHPINNLTWHIPKMRNLHKIWWIKFYGRHLVPLFSSCEWLKIIRLCHVPRNMRLINFFFTEFFARSARSSIGQTI